MGTSDERRTVDADVSTLTATILFGFGVAMFVLAALAVLVALIVALVRWIWPPDPPTLTEQIELPPWRPTVAANPEQVL